MKKYLIPALIGSTVTAIVGPVLFPFLGRLLRPVVKAGVKTGVSAYQSGMVRIEELKESLDDILAEVRQETAPED